MMRGMPAPPAPGPDRPRPAPFSAAAWLGVMVVLAVLAWQLVACRAATGGRFTYVLDDSYIGMAIARNFALHGAWSLNPAGFEPAASSPLWTALLALVVRLAGDHAGMPYALNAVFAVLLLLLVNAILREAVPGAWRRAALATVIAFATPVTAYAVTGMEHGLHAVLALALAWLAGTRIFGDAQGGRDGAAGPRALALLVALAALATLARFETLALVGVMAATAALRRRWADGIALLAGAALGLGAYAAFALPRGGMWLPNSVLVKSRLGLLRAADFDWSLVLRRIPEVLAAPRNAHFPVLIALALLVATLPAGAAGTAPRTGRGLLLALVPAILLQVQFGDVGSFFRYESWLVPIALCALVAALSGWRPDGNRAGASVRRGTVAILLVALAALLTVRAWHAATWAPLASRNIFEQQRQTARFVREEFPGEVVAVSDVGAVSYFGNARVLDLAGLGSMPVARARLADASDARWLGEFCSERGASLAVLYEAWLMGRGGIPPGWRAMSRWVIHDNYAADRDTVTIYSTNPAGKPRLRAALERFEPTLPPRVDVVRSGE